MRSTENLLCWTLHNYIIKARDHLTRVPCNPRGYGLPHRQPDGPSFHQVSGRLLGPRFLSHISVPSPTGCLAERGPEVESERCPEKQGELMDEELNQLKLSIKNFLCSSAVNLPYIDDKLYVLIISNLMKVVLVKLWDLLSENSSDFIQLHLILFSQQINVKVIIYYLQLKHNHNVYP